MPHDQLRTVFQAVQLRWRAPGTTATWAAFVGSLGGEIVEGEDDDDEQSWNGTVFVKANPGDAPMFMVAMVHWHSIKADTTKDECFWSLIVDTDATEDSSLVENAPTVTEFIERFVAGWPGETPIEVRATCHFGLTDGSPLFSWTPSPVMAGQTSIEPKVCTWECRPPHGTLSGFGVHLRPKPHLRTESRHTVELRPAFWLELAGIPLLDLLGLISSKA